MIAAIVLCGACGEDGGEPLAQASSPARAETGGGASTPEAPNEDLDPAEVEAFCAKAAELGQTANATDAEDPGEMSAQYDELLAVAPEQVREDLEVLRDAVDSMSELDASGAPLSPDEALEEMFSAVMSPELMTAALNLEAFMAEHCGIDMSSNGGLGLDDALGSDPGGDPSGDDPGGGTTVPGGDPSAGGTDIGLEDLDAIEEAHTGEAWVDKVYSTSIVNDQDIQLIGSDGSDGFGEPLTEQEAIDACEAVRTALEVRQPALSVEVLNGATVVARGAAGVPCAPA